MVVGGQCSSAEKMDQLTFIATGLIISKVLPKWRVLAGTGEDTPSNICWYSATS